jgi:heterogeneous nuclear rnp K-like protein
MGRTHEGRCHGHFWFERVVEVHGSAEAISRAINEIGRCLLEDWERGLGTVLFPPTASDERTGRRPDPSSGGYSGRRTNGESTHHRTRDGRESPTPGFPTSPQQHTNVRTQTISIPSDVVGCIIGRNGTKITEIQIVFLAPKYRLPKNLTRRANECSQS